jgi:hypothetical protein
MRGIAFILSTMVLISSFCCGKKCRQPVSSYGMPKEIDPYFGVYKPGSYWIYQNRQATRKDSLYITEASTVMTEELNIACIEYETRKFNLHSNWLNNGSILPVRYENNQQCCEAIFVHDANVNNVFSYFLGTDNGKPVIKSANSKLLDSMRAGNTTYYEVINQQRFSFETWFAPRVGLVQFVNGSDTFYLTKFKM